MKNVRGKRGGRKDRPSRKSSAEPAHLQSSSARIAEQVAPFWDCAAIEETKEDHVVPRQSVTTREHLRQFPEVEFEPLKPTYRIQTDKNGNHVKTTDPRYRRTWQSDKSLLLQGKPDPFGEDGGTTFIRETSHSKPRQPEIETKPNPEANGFDVTGRGRCGVDDIMEGLEAEIRAQKAK